MNETRPRRTGILSRCALSAASCVLVLLVLELGYRLFGPVIKFVEPTPQIPDPELGYSLKPNAARQYQGFDEWVEVRISSQGLRDAEFGPKAQGELRVLVLGDSYAYGAEYNAPLLFPELLEQKLAQRLTGVKVSVLNAGVSSFGTFQEYGMLCRYGPAFQPDVVVLQFCPNDLENNMKHRPEGIRALYESVQGVDRLERTLGSIARVSHLARFIALKIRADMQRRTTERLNIENHRAGKGRGVDYPQQLCLEFVDKIRTRSQELQAELVVLIIPFSMPGGEMPQATDTYSFLSRHCEESRIPWMSLPDAAERSGRLWSQCIQFHLTRRGHEVVAEQLLPLVGRIFEAASSR